MWTTGQELQNGKYKLEAMLGVGGFGVTYRAIERSSDRTVTIKTLNVVVQNKPNFTQAQEKFIKEAFRLSRCQHPHIVKVYDIFQEDGLWGMAMEFINGISLKDYLDRKGKLSESEGLRYIRQIGEALICVHDRGFLHRDVKPQNIMLRSRSSDGEDYEAVLIDFGSAREFTTGITATHTNIVTECFAPIEQYEIRSKRGEFTDVYALSATLYNVLTGKRPCPADIREQGTQLVPPIQHEPNLSQQVNDAILQGMAIDSERRTATVQQWLSLLQANSFRSDIEISDEGIEELLQSKNHQEEDRKNHNKKLYRSNNALEFTTLKKLLLTQNWQEADIFTNSLILNICGCDRNYLLTTESLANLPCKDLQKIDRLWRRYSRDRFGFSVQMRILQEFKISSPSKFDRPRFYERVGWRVKAYLVLPTFSIDAPIGHLPYKIWLYAESLPEFIQKLQDSNLK